MESAHAHLVDDEQGGEGRVLILDVESDGHTIEFLEVGSFTEVDEHKFAGLATVNTRSNTPQIATYLGHISYEEKVTIEIMVVVIAHEQAVAWFMPRIILRLWRQIIALLEVIPLRFALVSRLEVEWLRAYNLGL